MTDHEDYRHLATTLAVALIPAMGVQPSDDKGQSAWHHRLRQSVLATSDLVVHEAPRVMRTAAENAEYLQTFYDDQHEDRRVLFARVVDVRPGRGRAWIPVLNGWGDEDISLEDAQDLWRKHGSKDLSLYHQDGELRTAYGLEVYRTPLLTDPTGRGITVQRAAEASIGRYVRMFHLMESWSHGKKSGKLKVVAHLETLGDDIDLRAYNESAGYDGTFDDGDTSDAAPAKSSRGASGTRSRAATKPKPDPAPRRTAPAKTEEPKDDLDEFFGDDAAESPPAESPPDEQPPAERPTFEDYRQLVAAAAELGHDSEKVMESFRGLGYGREAAKDPEALGHVYTELTESSS